MTQNEINEAMDVVCKVFDKTQEIVNLMNTLSIKQIKYIECIYKMTIERTKLEEIIKEDSHEK